MTVLVITSRCDEIRLHLWVCAHIE